MSHTFNRTRYGQIFDGPAVGAITGEITFDDDGDGHAKPWRLGIGGNNLRSDDPTYSACCVFNITRENGEIVNWNIALSRTYPGTRDSVLGDDALAIYTCNSCNPQNAVEQASIGDGGNSPVHGFSHSFGTWRKTADDGDRDLDRIRNDGDSSGTEGDQPCTGGNTTNCDDNCPDVENPGQEDANSNGIGDACETGSPPVASFTFTPENPLPGVPITFTSTSTDPDGQIVESLWDFGDGTKAEGTEVTHTFMQEGEFDVALSVTDNQGETSPAEIKRIDTRCKKNGERASVPTDCDGDALHNDWEILGVDTDGDGTRDLDLNKQGDAPLKADPLKKDVFVWIDWLEKRGTDHSHRPNEAALNRVKAAFAKDDDDSAKEKIQLHIKLGRGIEERNDYRVIADRICASQCPKVCKTISNDFDEIKKLYFLDQGRGRMGVFHYVLYGHFL